MAAMSRSGSILVDQNGLTRFEDRNRVKDGDHTRHPEFAIARWAVDNLTPAERAVATVYTSGEHCPMCAAAHAWGRPGSHRLRRIIGAADPVAGRVGLRPSARGASADQRGRPRCRCRWTSTRTRRHDEGPLRSEVPAMSEPAWVEHVIWWQVYPLGFVGAYPAGSASER